MTQSFIAKVEELREANLYLAFLPAGSAIVRSTEGWIVSVYLVLGKSYQHATGSGKTLHEALLNAKAEEKSLKANRS